MSQEQLNVLLVVGSLKEQSVNRVVLEYLAEKFRSAGCAVDFLDLAREPLELFNPDKRGVGGDYGAFAARVERADVLVLGSPDYHGCISGTLKNFTDYFWKEFTGKLFVPVVASHEKGLTVIEQITTIARQCYAWTLPYGVSAAEDRDVANGRVTNKALISRLDMVARDARVYGALLAGQRLADLKSPESGFLSRHPKA